MSDKDWDLDELLNFEYDRPKPEEIPNHQFTINNKTKPSLAPLRDEAPSARDVAIKEAQEAAYLKYREEYAAKNKKNEARAEKKAAKESLKARKQEMKAEKKANKKASRKKDRKPVATSVVRTASESSKFYKFTKFLSVPYVILFAVFTIAMTIMNVLPFWMLLALYIVLGLLSLIIVIQLTKDNIKKWAKVLATTMAVILMVVYGVGTAYAMGTLSFLGATSVKNEDSVGRITKEPSNTLMTGMDVWHKIDEQGRSDVNMLVTVNPKTSTILMTSVPRDYEIRLPDMGYATDKLTHSGFYSVETTIGAMEDLLGVNTNYYVKVNFTTVCKFVDAIGGLDFDNPVEFKSAISPNYYPKGQIHVDGHGALYYARERKAFLGGDNERVKNQQFIFQLMLEKAMSSKTMLLSYNKILSSLEDYFEMSFSSSEIRQLVKFQLAKNPKWKIYKNTLVGSGASMPTYTTGSQKVYVTAQDPTSVANAQNLIQAVMDGKQLTEDEDGNVIVAPEEETAE